MIYPLLAVDNIKNKLYYLYDLILFVCFLKLNISTDDNINIFNNLLCHIDVINLRTITTSVKIIQKRYIYREYLLYF